MATNLRGRSGAQFKFWKGAGRPRYILEGGALILAIGTLFLAYRYYFGDVAETFDEAVCGKPLQELCLMDDRIIDACKVFTVKCCCFCGLPSF